MGDRVDGTNEGTESLSTRQTVRILLVDDQVDLAEVTALHLQQRRNHFEVTVVDSGPEALEALDAATFDCLVSDYEMPEIDGLALLRAVNERESSIPFILYTGRGSEEIASEAISAGVTDYLQKRATSDQYDVLTNRIENAVARRRSERARQESEGRYENLVEASPHAILVHYGEDVVYVNERMVELFGFDHREQVYGTEAMSYVHPDDRAEIRERMRTVLDDRDEADWVGWRLLRDDGEVRRVESRGTPVVYDGKRAVQVVVRDVSERHSRKRQLRTLDEGTSDLLAASSAEAVGEIVTTVATALVEEASATVFQAIDDRLTVLAGHSSADDGSHCPEDAVEMAVYRAGEPRVVEEYSGEAASDDAETAFVVPLGDHGVLTVIAPGLDGFDGGNRALLSTLSQLATATLDRLARR